ncbi:hypothetical protein GCM10011416_20300 [Polaribacter pacificus]|uniref:Response regulatory domain-containing protein n=1 Tax=Polaribacter pacificus TaxID=1775173 RepID=A0A917MET6_9FLAO|nr:hypothetical protein [Polaribacter pacificus]GGH01480.1 hypothetical protein GCM10011416_20300 [Polaribacter pacificus]
MSQEFESIEEIKILLVENTEEHTRKFLELAKVNGWTVYTQQGSMDAIRWLKNNAAPDLMIIDQNASPLDGFQTTDYIQSELKINVPTLISNYNNSQMSDDDTLLDFINKPFSELSLKIIKAKLIRKQPLIKLVDKAYSLNYLRSLSDGNEEFVLTSLNLFRDSVAVKLIEIKTALFNEEYKSVRDLAHNIKPSFGTLESTHGRDLCNQLVYKATEKDISGLVEQLDQLYNTINIQLKKDIPSYTQV